MKTLITTVLLIAISLTHVQCQEEGEVDVIQPADRCADIICPAGQICRGGACVCEDVCSSEWNLGMRKICVNNQYTYKHECDWNRHKCYCKQRGDARCTSNNFQKNAIDTNSYISYYGECRNLKSECDFNQQWETEAWVNFKQWFRYLFTYKFSVPYTKEDADENSLVAGFTDKARKNAQILVKDVSAATMDKITAFWFCQMDVDNSNSLSNNELSALTRILLPTTPCVSEFLNRCSGGSEFSRENWNTCFKIDAGSGSVNCADYR